MEGISGRFKHGHAIFGKRSDAYVCWVNMRQRCLNSLANGYESNGALGVGICKEWSRFERFYEDMGDPPPRKMLCRRNLGQDYSPENCFWGDRIVWLEHNGLKKPETFWADLFGISLCALQTFRQQGMTLAEIENMLFSQ